MSRTWLPLAATRASMQRSDMRLATTLSFEGTNLTRQRPPVSASEFGREPVHLLNARTLWVRLAYRQHLRLGSRVAGRVRLFSR